MTGGLMERSGKRLSAESVAELIAPGTIWKTARIDRGARYCTHSAPTTPISGGEKS